MSGGTFAHCPDCGRLNIYGARCVCRTPEPAECDCTHNGNRFVVGPKCLQRMRDAWRATTEATR